LGERSKSKLPKNSTINPTPGVKEDSSEAKTVTTTLTAPASESSHREAVQKCPSQAKTVLRPQKATTTNRAVSSQMQKTIVSNNMAQARQRVRFSSNTPKQLHTSCVFGFFWPKGCSSFSLPVFCQLLSHSLFLFCQLAFVPLLLFILFLQFFFHSFVHSNPGPSSY